MANTPKFCRQCGYPLEEDARFCERCGAPAKGRLAAPPAPAGEEPPTQPVAARGSLLRALAIVTGVTLLLLVAAILVWFGLPSLVSRLPWLAAAPAMQAEAFTATPTASLTPAPRTSTPTPILTLTLPAPTATRASPAPLPAAGVTEVVVQGLRFTYDPSLWAGYHAETRPENPPADGVAPWDVVSEHIYVTFDDDLLAGASQTPSLYVFPAEAYAAINPTARETIDALAALLRDRPAAVEGDLPFLPPSDAAQVFHAKVDYLPFAGGSGVRYLTQLAQDQTPVNNQGLFYTFQGLTADGRYYVTAIFPVHHPDLPADAALTPAQGDPEYLAETVTMLDDQPDDAFSPSLDQLDALARSLVLR